MFPNRKPFESLNRQNSFLPVISPMAKRQIHSMYHSPDPVAVNQTLIENNQFPQAQYTQEQFQFPISVSSKNLTPINAQSHQNQNQIEYPEKSLPEPIEEEFTHLDNQRIEEEFEFLEL